MQSKYPVFDRSRLRVRPLREREHDMDLGHLLAVDEQVEEADSKLAASLELVAPEARRERTGRKDSHDGSPRHQVGGCPDRSLTCSRGGAFTHVAMNGAGAIHDFELARIGATTESVARYIRDR